MDLVVAPLEVDSLPHFMVREVVEEKLVLLVDLVPQEFLSSTLLND